LIDRRAFITLIGGSILAEPFVTEAQQAGKISRVGMLFLGSASAQGVRAQLIRDELRKLGYVEGQTVMFEVRWADGRLDRVSELARELVRADVDLIVTSGSQLVQAIRPIAGNIPIVVGVMSDPVNAGFAASFARPGGNITGLAFQDSDLGTKRLQLLTEVVPRLSRIALLFDPRGPDEATRTLAAAILRDTQTAARALGITTHVFRVGRVSDLENAFSRAKRVGAQAVLEISSPLFAAYRPAFVDLATKHQLPVACESSEFVVLGCLLSYGPSFDDMFRRAAVYVDKILKGAKPGDLPIEQPTKFELVVNLKTAEALGLTIPQSVLLQADQVIE
jgi:putative ABC transport system substrate-binding protein